VVGIAQQSGALSSKGGWGTRRDALLMDVEWQADLHSPPQR
jgi:hypothetical protein